MPIFGHVSLYCRRSSAGNWNRKLMPEAESQDSGSEFGIQLPVLNRFGFGIRIQHLNAKPEIENPNLNAGS